MPSLRTLLPFVTVALLSMALASALVSCTARQPGQPPAQATADAPAPAPKPLAPSVEAPAHAPSAAPPVANAPAEGAAKPAKQLDCPAKRPEICTQQYQPVCASVDTGIRCIKAPCPSGEQREFSNWCVACTNPKVTTYVDGPCPGGAPRPSPESMPQ
jgi:hypothetical protein